MSDVQPVPGDRAPTLTAPPRIAALPTLPLFHRIAGRRVVVVGASEGVRWKAELLAAAGADVYVFAGDGDGARLFDDLPGGGSITVEARGWADDDLLEAALAVADLAEPTDAARFVAAARRIRVPVNVVDRTDDCDVIFGTIVNRAPVVLAISTDGGAPMLGQSIRARIEAVLPRGLAAWASAAREWRPQLKARLVDFADRRAFWERFTRRAWENIDRAPTEADRDALVADVVPGAPRGRVLLVGAGPGDPELLTLKAVRALQAATVVLYDDLVGPEVLELARREARRIAVGKKGRGPSCKQSEINAQIVDLAATGEIVVRLKGGDPLIFGRATEEVDACRAAGIPVEIVPGISAAQGAAASLGISLTERHVARRVQYVTGHGADGRLPEDIDWASVADSRATTVVYMPRGTLDQFAARAIAEGLDPATPVVAVAAATRADEQQAFGTVADLPVLAARLDAALPVTVIVGAVVAAKQSAELQLQTMSAAE